MLDSFFSSSFFPFSVINPHLFDQFPSLFHHISFLFSTFDFWEMDGDGDGVNYIFWIFFWLDFWVGGGGYLSLWIYVRGWDGMGCGSGGKVSWAIRLCTVCRNYGT